MASGHPVILGLLLHVGSPPAKVCEEGGKRAVDDPNDGKGFHQVDIARPPGLRASNHRVHAKGGGSFYALPASPLQASSQLLS